MIYFIYFVVIFLSNTLGAVSGMGGGIIIKPVLDMLNYHSLISITFYSSVAVFTMAIASTYKQYKNGIQVNWKNSLFVSLGSLIGGSLGDKLLHTFISFFHSEETVIAIQSIILILTLLLVLFYGKFSSFSFHFHSISSYFIVGIILGSFSTFLGIGGGPINVAILMLFFGLDMKESTVYSIITIFFSQLSKLSSTFLTTGFHPFDLSFLAIIIPAALFGGYLGGHLSNKLHSRQVHLLFHLIVVLVILINVYNLLQVLGYI